jgi:hypothetical protein
MHSHSRNGVDGVGLDVLTCYVHLLASPRDASTFADGEGPQALMLSDFTTGLKTYYRSRFGLDVLSWGAKLEFKHDRRSRKHLTNEIGEFALLPNKADAHTLWPCRRRQVILFC